MKRRLQVLALCAAALLAASMMAQDTGGGGGGDSSGGGDATGGSTGSGMSGATGGGSTTEGGGNTNGGTTGGQNGNGTAPGGGMGTTPGGGDLFGPGMGGGRTGGTGDVEGGGSTILPGVSPSPSAPASTGTSPWSPVSPTPSPTPNPFISGAQAGALQQQPVTFSLPGGYGGKAPETFTLGEGRLAKPPITFTLTTSEGYDDNIFSADSHIVPTPTPLPGATPRLEGRIVGYRETLPAPPVPIILLFRPHVPTLTGTAPQQLGVIGSAVSTASLAVEAQHGSPRTVVTMDALLSEQIYWQQPGGKEDYSGSFDLSFDHRLTPRASISLSTNLTYQQSPNFALINAPTNNGNNGGNYLNGDAKIDLSYQWSSRISTVTSYDLGLNLLQTNAGNNLYTSTIGTQFRYTVSARNTITAELRRATTDYPSNTMSNSSGTFYLVGLDSFITSKLRNTISGGLEADTYSSGMAGQTNPYVETATTLGFARGAALEWSNRYGSQTTGNAFDTEKSYRTTLTYSQPLSTKLVASLSIAYNILWVVDTQSSAGSYTQNQLQASLNLGYTITPRFSMNLSYTYNDLLSTEVNSSYQRDQTYLGGSYLFR